MVWVPNRYCWFDGDFHEFGSRTPRTQPSSRCGILTHDNHDLAADGAVRASDWTGKELNRLFQLSRISPSAARKALKAKVSND
jgi:hypothetical protein